MIRPAGCILSVTIGSGKQVVSGIPKHKLAPLNSCERISTSAEGFVYSFGFKFDCFFTGF
jgi:hypothetical protein